MCLLRNPVLGKWAHVARSLSTSCGNTLRQTQQIFIAIYTPRQTMGTKITRSCLLCPFFTRFDLFSVQCYSFQGVLEQGHAHGSSLEHLWTTDWEAETLNCRIAFHSALPLCGSVLQPLDYLHKRFQKSITEKLAKFVSVPRQKCPHSGESLRLWILMLHKFFPACMLEVPLGCGLYFFFRPHFPHDILPTQQQPSLWAGRFTASLLLSLLLWFPRKKKNTYH